MTRLSNKLRKWVNESNGDEALTYFCQGCNSAHTIQTKGNPAWGWNGDVEKPIFTPSVLVTGRDFTDKGHETLEAWHDAGCPKPAPIFESQDIRCHTFVGCNGAQPGEVIFLSDCTHTLAGQVLPLPDFPEWMS